MCEEQSDGPGGELAKSTNLSLSADELLKIAYGAEFGKTGHALEGHTIVNDVDVATAIDSDGSSLLYGELLPSGVETLYEALFAGRQEAAGPILELGMGTGKVALQIFLASRRDVYGVELAPSRWALAKAAIQRVAEAAPERFRFEATGSTSARLTDLSEQRFCEVVCGSLLDTPVQMLNDASAVVMEVCLPVEVQRAASAVLQNCKPGSRCVCYAPMHNLVDACRLAPVKDVGDGCGGILLNVSWKPHGFGFAFYQLAESAEAAQCLWTERAAQPSDAKIETDNTGCPSRARNVKYTDAVLGSPRSSYGWGKGDRIFVGYSWLPFIDLGNPGDGSKDGLDGVTWMLARVIAVDQDGLATICYEDDGTIEERVHPERIRKEGCMAPREVVNVDWGDF